MFYESALTNELCVGLCTGSVLIVVGSCLIGVGGFMFMLSLHSLLEKNCCSTSVHPEASSSSLSLSRRIVALSLSYDRPRVTPGACVFVGTCSPLNEVGGGLLG